MKKQNVAVVGVGAVGKEMLRVLEQRRFPVGQLHVLARSSREIVVDEKKYSVREIKSEEFEGMNIALFAGTEGEKGAALTYAKEANKRNCIVIDNGADFRMDPNIPLVVPEVNPQDVKLHKGIIANPNCSTIQMVVALWPIHKTTKIKRIIASTYQAASGAGRSAVEELLHETQEELEKLGIGKKSQDIEHPGQKVLPHQIAFNVIPHISRFEDLDFTTEEWKMVRETRKIMHDNSIKISATTVRVPVITGHCESIYIETEKILSPQQVREILKNAPGVKVIDEPSSCPADPKRRTYPVPIEADGKDETFVGRIRKDPFVENGLWLWVVSDNLRKGAALNAVQIAELLL